jgi:hypothetical protein
MGWRKRRGTGQWQEVRAHAQSGDTTTARAQQRLVGDGDRQPHRQGSQEED